MAMLQDRAF